MPPLAERLIRAAYRAVKAASVVTGGALLLVVGYPRSWVHVNNAGLTMSGFLWGIGRVVFLVVLVAAFIGHALGLRSPRRVRALHEAGHISSSEASFNSVA